MMNIILYSLCGIILLACSTTKSASAIIGAQKTPLVAFANAEKKEFYICEGDTIFISERTNKLAQYSKIISCLNKEGKYGNDVANQEIAKIISRTGYDALQSFSRRGILGTLRGETIFEAFLNLGIDDTPMYDHDGNAGPETMTYINYSIMSFMIENIAGKAVEEYVKEVNTFPMPEYAYLYEEKIRVSVNQIRYNTIKQAWEEGKVVLKPYYKKP